MERVSGRRGRRGRGTFRREEMGEEEEMMSFHLLLKSVRLTGTVRRLADWLGWGRERGEAYMYM